MASKGHQKTDLIVEGSIQGACRLNRALLMENTALTV